MSKTQEYRHDLIARLTEAGAEFNRRCAAVPDPQRPLEPGGWNVHQLAVHVRDVDRHVYGMRMRRTVEQDDPLFENFDADTWMAGHYDPAEPLTAVLQDLSSGLAGLTAWLVGLPVEAWQRTSRHASQGGGLTLQTWVERLLVHYDEHLATLRSGSAPRE